MYIPPVTVNINNLPTGSATHTECVKALGALSPPALVIIPLEQEAGQVHFNSHFTEEENVLSS